MNFGKILLPCLLLTGVTLVIGIVVVGDAPAARAAPACATLEADPGPPPIIVERCLSLDPETATRGVGSEHTVTATVTDDGQPVLEEEFVIWVESGPNMGKNSYLLLLMSDVNGQAQFTYTADGGLGRDTIAACLADFEISTTDCADQDDGPPVIIIKKTACMSTAWTVPAGDSDCDGFTDAAEAAIGTDPQAFCGPNAWPPDIFANNVVDLQDLSAILPYLFQPSAGNARYNLKVDSVVDIQDMSTVLPFLFRSCVP